MLILMDYFNFDAVLYFDRLKENVGCSWETVSVIFFVMFNYWKDVMHHSKLISYSQPIRTTQSSAVAVAGVAVVHPGVWPRPAPPTAPSARCSWPRTLPSLPSWRPSWPSCHPGLPVATTPELPPPLQPHNPPGSRSTTCPTWPRWVDWQRMTYKPIFVSGV